MGNRELGRIGEQAAAELLRMEGYEILERNYRCQAGEIDLIAARGSEVSFVEVKTRRNDHYGDPCEAVGAQKILSYKAEPRCIIYRSRRCFMTTCGFMW